MALTANLFRDRRQPRLVNGRLVRDGDNHEQQQQHSQQDSSVSSHTARTIHVGRLVLVVALLLGLVVTNPANPTYMTIGRDGNDEKDHPSSSHSRNGGHRRHQGLALWELVRLLAQDPDDDDARARRRRRNESPTFATRGSQKTLQYGLFAVVEPRPHQLEIWALHTRLLECDDSLSDNHQKWWLSSSSLEYYYCQPLRQALTLPSPLRSTTTARLFQPQQDAVEQFLGLQEPWSERKYFVVYQGLLALLLTTACAFWIRMGPSPPSDNNSNSITRIGTALLTRSLGPNPHQLLSSIVITLCDLSWIVGPTLAVMQELIQHQSQNSWFRLYPAKRMGVDDDDEFAEWCNYIVAVMVFFVAASLANWTLVPWSTHNHRFTLASLPPLGYSSDVWAAAALGYLRVVVKGTSDGPMHIWDTTKKEDAILSVAGLWPVSIVAATWLRLAFAVWWHCRRQSSQRQNYILSVLGLWFSADMMGSLLAMYQVEHHFAVVMVNNVYQGLSQLLRPLVPWI